MFKEENKIKKIAFIIQSLHIGGTETYIKRIAEKLKDRFEFHFIATQNPDISSDFHSIGLATYIKSPEKIIKYLKSNKIDLLQYGNLPEYKNYALKAQVPIIVERIAGPRSLKNDHKGVSHIISSSEGMVKKIKAQYNGPISVIKNGIEIKEHQPYRYFPADDWVVIYPCSRLGRGQKIDDFIKACIIAKKMNERIKVIITGDRPNQKGYEDIRGELKKLAQPLGKSCVFTGWVENMMEIISGTNLSVISAGTHGISNALIESAALKKPIIASDVGQTNEICHHGKNGYLFRAGDVEQLAKYILYLSKTPTVCDKFGTAGFEIVVDEFNIEHQAEKHAKLYERL